MSMDFVNNPIYNNYGVPMSPNGSMGNFSGNQNITQNQMENRVVDIRALETPQITVDTGHRSRFTIKGESNSNGLNIPVDLEVPDVEKEKRKRGRPRKESGSNEIIRVGDSKSEPLSGTVEDTPTAYTYMETTGMLRETLGQIDALSSELMKEFENVRHNKMMKNKYNTLVGLSENVGSLISNKISAIREINSSISKSNDLDYKRLKDRKAAEAGVDDDKYIADLYKSFIQNPINNAPNPQMPQINPSLFGSGIVRANIRSGDVTSNGPVDAGYLNYMSNLTPEQNMMRYENNPNVKQVVVFDAASGNKFFQVMDVSTGEVIPNVPVYDQMFMEDTTLDLKTKIAKNINLNETFPIIVINEGVTSEY